LAGFVFAAFASLGVSGLTFFAGFFAFFLAGLSTSAAVAAFFLLAIFCFSPHIAVRESIRITLNCGSFQLTPASISLGVSSLIEPNQS
jgi:hypothetical protein